MAEKYDDKEIVVRLRGEALTSSTGKPFTVSIIRWIRFKITSPVHRVPPEHLLSARFVRDMAPACGSSITGSTAALSQRRNANQTCHMLSPSMTPLIDLYQNGWHTPDIFIHNPQRKLYEVYYARCIGIPSGRSPPPGFGIITRRTGSGR